MPISTPPKPISSPHRLSLSSVSAPPAHIDLDALRKEISLLEKHLDSVKADEEEAQEQLKSLTYAADLTHGEVARRKRANQELDSAFQQGDGENDEEKKIGMLGQLEGDLLNAKRDAANVTFEVEQLMFTLKRMREKERGMESPRLDVQRSPRVGSGSMGMTSPIRKMGRLIADVDGVLLEGDDVIEARIGVGMAGGVGLYSYGEAEQVVALDEQNINIEQLNETDLEKLKQALTCVDLMDDSVICGVMEAVKGVIDMVEGGLK